MARYCIVTGGIVVNTIDYETVPSAPPPGFSSGYEAVQSLVGQIGWLWNGSVFSDPNPPPVPQLDIGVFNSDMARNVKRSIKGTKLDPGPLEILTRQSASGVVNAISSK